MRGFDLVLASFVPPGAEVALISPYLAEIGDRLSEGRCIHPVPVVDGHVPTLPEAFASASLGMVLVRYGMEMLDDPANLLTTCAERGLPMVCRYFYDHSFRQELEDWAPWRHAFAHGEFEALATACGYRIEASAMQRSVPIHLMLPTTHLQNETWWRGAEGRNFVGRRKKRGERELALLEDTTIRKDWRSSPKWESRSKFVADIIPDGLHVLDIGCGSMYLRDHLRTRTYTPLDQIAHDERTVVVNMNKAMIPEPVVRAADPVTALGVFEYLVNPDEHFRQIARLGKPLLLTYNIAEGRKVGDDAQLTAWMNNMHTIDLVRMLLDCGFNLQTVIDFDSKQRIFVCTPRGWSPKPWWEHLGESKAKGIHAPAWMHGESLDD